MNISNKKLTAQEMSDKGIKKYIYINPIFQIAAFVAILIFITSFNVAHQIFAQLFN